MHVEAELFGTFAGSGIFIAINHMQNEEGDPGI